MNPFNLKMFECIDVKGIVTFDKSKSFTLGKMDKEIKDLREAHNTSRYYHIQRMPNYFTVGYGNSSIRVTYATMAQLGIKELCEQAFRLYQSETSKRCRWRNDWTNAKRRNLPISEELFYNSSWQYYCRRLSKSLFVFVFLDIVV